MCSLRHRAFQHFHVQFQMSLSNHWILNRITFLVILDGIVFQNIHFSSDAAWTNNVFLLWKFQRETKYLKLQLQSNKVVKLFKPVAPKFLRFFSLKSFNTVSNSFQFTNSVFSFQFPFVDFFSCGANKVCVCLCARVWV